MARLTLSSSPLMLQNKSKQNEMLVAGAAVGMATVFAAPFSGEPPSCLLGVPSASCRLYDGLAPLPSLILPGFYCEHMGRQGDIEPFR